MFIDVYRISAISVLLVSQIFPQVDNLQTLYEINEQFDHSNYSFVSVQFLFLPSVTNIIPPITS